MSHEPSELGAGEIRIEQKSGPGREQALAAAGFEPFAKFGGAAILPDDRAVDGAAAGAVPQQRGFALIGDADGGDLARGGAGAAQRAAAGRKRRRPQVFGVVLDLAVGREMLRKLLLRKRRDRGVGAKQNGARGRRALVDRQHIRHRLPPLGRTSGAPNLPMAANFANKNSAANAAERAGRDRSIPSLSGLKRGGVGFAGADAHRMLERHHEDLAVADLAGLGGARDRVDHLVD